MMADYLQRDLVKGSLCFPLHPPYLSGQFPGDPRWLLVVFFGALAGDVGGEGSWRGLDWD